MNGLGKYCHDFPRLAKDSGYTFQLHRGRINWSDIDNLNVQDIVDNRDFRLLEQNLIHVVNCNLETEYDLKILDKNFVKLFKLAQLGIDYLSYCELYLDRCVLLLQEQLASCQEECLLLKEENERKDEEIKKSKKRVKAQAQNFKCNKCEKLFLSESYLQSHERRRHRNVTEAGTCQTESSVVVAHRGQQTEAPYSSSTSTQTFPRGKMATVETSTEEETEKMADQESKIEDLKRDLEELKIRLSAAEKTMEEKKNEEKSGFHGNYPNNFPGAVIPVIHSFIPQTGAGCFHVSSARGGLPVCSAGNQFAYPPEEDFAKENRDPNRSIDSCQSKESPMRDDTSVRPALRAVNIVESPTNKVPAADVSELLINLSPENSPIVLSPVKCEDREPPKPEVVPSEEEQQRRFVARREAFKRVPKKAPSPEKFMEVECLTSVRSFGDLQRLESGSSSESVYSRTSTPIRRSKGPSLELVPSLEVECEASPEKERKSKPREDKSKSLLRQMVRKKSPKLQELTSNLRSSFAQLYDTVSAAGKRSGEGKRLESKSDIVDGLNERLRELGVDPEWKGIPKETMRQKLKILENDRNLLSKENKLYPYIRSKLQKHVMKRLKTNSVLSRSKAASSAEVIIAETTAENKKREEAPLKIYDSDEECAAGESAARNDHGDDDDSKPREDIANRHTQPNRADIKPEAEDKETDLSIFQAGKFKWETGSKVAVPTCSDFDDNSSDEEKAVAVASSPTDVIASFPKKPDDDIASSRNSRNESQSILKNETEKSQGNMATKKKVLFAEELEVFDASLREGQTGDKTKEFDLVSGVDDLDDWSIESEWTVSNK